MTPEETFTGWAIVELMGHNKTAGYVSEGSVGGVPLMRLDVQTTDERHVTQYYGEKALYCVTPSTEEICKAFAERHAPAPVSRFELPALSGPQPEPPDFSAPEFPDFDIDGEDPDDENLNDPPY